LQPPYAVACVSDMQLKASRESNFPVSPAVSGAVFEPGALETRECMAWSAPASSPKRHAAQLLGQLPARSRLAQAIPPRAQGISWVQPAGELRPRPAASVGKALTNRFAGQGRQHRLSGGHDSRGRTPGDICHQRGGSRRGCSAVADASEDYWLLRTRISVVVVRGSG
jgi:hypothetical protein